MATHKRLVLAEVREAMVALITMEVEVVMRATMQNKRAATHLVAHPPRTHPHTQNSPYQGDHRSCANPTRTPYSRWIPLDPPAV